MENFSEPFLVKVANRILSEHPGSMYQACVVLPNRRAGVFLKRYLSAGLENPAFAPAIFSIEDFVFELVSLNQADQLVLLWELYACYRKSGLQKPQSFDEFLKWGSLLLQDFEDADMYLADVNALFSYLSEAKAIELWNPGNDHLTPGQQRYLAFYRSLSGLYDLFTQSLLDQGMAYKGLAFRKLSEELAEKIPGLRWKHFYFAGFNALTPAEKEIINALLKLKVTRLFDADAYYLNDPKQEAGKYLREIAGEIKSGEFQWTTQGLTQGSKKITVTGVPHNTGQVLVAGSLLSKIKPEDENHTAIVLNDESLLIPLLNILPDNIGHFNVTMGYPFSLTPAYSLMDTLLNLHLQAYDLDRNREGENQGQPAMRYYFRNLAGLLKHPYFRKLTEDNKSGTDPVNSLLSQGKIFYTGEEIFSHFDGLELAGELLKTALADWKHASAAIEGMIALNRLIAFRLKESDEDSRHRMDIEYLHQFYLMLNRLKLLAERAGEELSLRGLQALIRSIASGTQLPFTGEPLKGVQIMGMLETRTLDFKNIIMLNANEGVLPAGKHGNSFIPFDIRRDFRLPVYSDRDAVFAYHFYRLLQRCENMHLLYNTTPDELGGGEKSRFIQQIAYELIKANPKIDYRENFYSPPVSFDQAVVDIVIGKSDAIASRLAEMSQHGLSPSALATYVKCPLKFYFSHVLKISEQETIDDTMDASVFGTGIHEALRQLYQPYLNKPLKAENLDAIGARANQTLHERFLAAWNNNDLSYGKNLLMVKVAESFLRRFVRMEKENLEEVMQRGGEIIIEAVEKHLAKDKPVEIFVNFQGKDAFPVRLRGHADRIDKIAGQVRIIDYKTGTVKATELKIDDLDQLIQDAKKEKALQLAIYSFLYAKEYGQSLPAAGIISFRSLNSGFMPVKLPAGSAASTVEIEKMLQVLLNEIYDLSIPFRQTEDTDNCKFCPFTGVCAR